MFLSKKNQAGPACLDKNHLQPHDATHVPQPKDMASARAWAVSNSFTNWLPSPLMSLVMSHDSHSFQGSKLQGLTKKRAILWVPIPHLYKARIFGSELVNLGKK